MADKPNIGVPNIFPALRYEDAPAAIAWLGKAFGFEKKLVVPGDDNSVMHAELRMRDGLVLSRHDELPFEAEGLAQPIDGSRRVPVAKRGEYVGDTDAGFVGHGALHPLP